MKHEILCPVGNMECLYQAVANGADAVYLSLKNYGARKFADNFSSDTVIDAIKYCHLYGVKVFVTMNTLVKTEEVPSFLEQVEFLHKNHVDAIIMQDFGMICLVREMFPNLEIHASTQANNSSVDTVKLFYKLGVKRVVFSREMSIEEIEKIDVPIEKEVFVHGALCISYSGCCLMSSMIGNRSGNRGECAGCCRLPYSLFYKNDLINKGYLLSTKELNTSPLINKLLDSNIYSFKIEGRMKSPLYVGFITRFYRNLVDNYYDNKKAIEENEKLKTIFNREFTVGRLFNCDDIINTKSPNHIGMPIGKVVEITPKKIKIKLNRRLNQGDGIRFLQSGKGFIVNYMYDKNNKLISYSDDYCYLLNTINLSDKDEVSKTYDIKLNQEYETLPKRNIDVSVTVKAKIGSKLMINISDGVNSCFSYASIVEEAKNTPISKDRIKKQVEKMGNTPFVCKNTIIDMDDNIFISIKELNELRRLIISKLIDKRISCKDDFLKKDISFEKIDLKYTSFTTVSVYNEEQLKKCLELGVERIYVNNYQLYKKYSKNNNVYLKTKRCSFNILNNLEKNSLVGDYFDFSLDTNNLVGDYPLNVYNIYTAYYLYKMGLNIVTLSLELSNYEIDKFISSFKNKFSFLPSIEIVCYGRSMNMIIKGNILNLNVDDYNYQLKDIKNRSFPVYFDGCNTYVLNYCNRKIDNKKILGNYLNTRLDFFLEDSKEVKNIVNMYQ